MKYTKRKCDNCGAATNKPSRYGETKYCSLECCYEHRRRCKNTAAKCFSCLALVGLRPSEAGRIMCINGSIVAKAWRRQGIKQTKPQGGSWKSWSATQRKMDRDASDLYKKTRMLDIKEASSIGFDWSCIWKQERVKRDQREKYHAMTDEQKKDYNKQATERRKERREQYPDVYRKHRERVNKWRRDNPDIADKWRRDNPEKYRESRRKSVKKRMKNDPAFRAATNMRKRFRQVMKGVKNGGSAHYSDKLGCTTEEFNKHMKSMFTTEMTWDNYGTYWVVDHVLPVASFDHTDREQVKRCWHYTNLQPMEAMENIKKSDKITKPQMSLMLNYSTQSQ